MNLKINQLVQSANEKIAKEGAVQGYFARRDSYKLSRQFLPALEQELESLKQELDTLDITATCNIMGNHMTSAPAIVLVVNLKRISIYRQNQLSLRDSAWSHWSIPLVAFKQTYVRQNGARILALHHAELVDKTAGNNTILEICKQMRREMLKELSRAVRAGIHWNELAEKYGPEVLKDICDGYRNMCKYTDLNIIFAQPPEHQELSNAWNSCMLNPTNMELFKALATRLDSEGIH